MHILHRNEAETLPSAPFGRLLPALLRCPRWLRTFVASTTRRLQTLIALGQKAHFAIRHLPLDVLGAWFLLVPLEPPSGHRGCEGEVSGGLHRFVHAEDVIGDITCDLTAAQPDMPSKQQPSQQCCTTRTCEVSAKQLHGLLIPRVCICEPSGNQTFAHVT